MAGTDRVTKAGAYIEAGGAALQATKLGVYVEITEPQDVSSAVTKLGVYVEITNAMDRVSQLGVYVELRTEELVTKAGAYVEFHIPPPNPPTLARIGDFTALLSSLDFLPTVNPPFTLTPVRWSWRDFGGANVAEIAADGQLSSLLNWLPELPRMPVVIANPIGTEVWCGFVNSVELQVEGLIISITLDGMANRVMVHFQRLDEGETEAVDDYTSLGTNEDGEFRYGRFEVLYEFGQSSTAQAESIRDAILAELSQIQSDTRIGDRQEISARLLCTGWAHSFAFELYSNVSTVNLPISDQIDIIGQQMQYISTIDIVDENSIESNVYREMGTAYDALEELASVANSDGDAMRLSVPRARLLRYEKTYRDEDQYLHINGQFSRINRYPLQPGEMILGWCRDVGTRMIGKLANANRFYVEESEFEAESGRYTIRTRGTQSPWRQ